MENFGKSLVNSGSIVNSMDENPGEELGLEELSEVDSQRRSYKWLR